MGVEQLPLIAILAPLTLVVGAIYVLGPSLPMHRPAARWFVFASVWLAVLRYLDWRLFVTVLPATGSAVELCWIWFVFMLEVIAHGDALILYMTFLRTTDRRREADAHEQRLRGTAIATLPVVDVYIPTYNEPFNVLEKTIVGALALDYPHVQIWVLDDGRRSWLRDYCTSKGVGYLTRPNNAHAKAGNINHALKHTDGEFVAIFDADFVPQRDFLMRTMGFFSDPKVGIVQVPHAFYNHDPMQTNLAMRKALPDDQRFFFEAIMPSRDAWDAAFCCGSNSITRRAAMRDVGDALPTGSITEDMLLSLSMLRRGYITRYLCERLAFGLAPESLKAFFVQRERWARGALQIMYLPEGPFGHNLHFMHRLMFLPTHWLSQSLTATMAIVTPLVFLWTGLPPLVNVTIESVVHYLLPMVMAMVGGITVFAQKRYFPLAAQVLATFQAFKLMPAILQTLIRPHGLLFKVTPKGADAAGLGYERCIYWISAALMIATLLGMTVNALPEWRLVEQSALVPLVAFWGVVNVTVLFLVCMLCVPIPIRRAEERFEISEPVAIRGRDNLHLIGRLVDISLSGVAIAFDGRRGLPWLKGDAVQAHVADVGVIRCKVTRVHDRVVGLHFDLPPSVERDLLIRKIFTSGHDTTMVTTSAWRATFAMISRIWSVQSNVSLAMPETESSPPEGRLPAATLVLKPSYAGVQLNELAVQRQSIAG